MGKYGGRRFYLSDENGSEYSTKTSLGDRVMGLTGNITCLCVGTMITELPNAKKYLPMGRMKTGHVFISKYNICHE